MGVEVDVEPQLTSREQSVSLLELFYDLIFVYAISQVTGIIHTPDYGVETLVDYVISSYVVLRAWLHMTNYINRFGRTRRTNVVLVVNMCAAVLMSTAIAGRWTDDLSLINETLVVMLGSVAIMYTSHLNDGPNERVMAIYSLKTIVPGCVIYFVAGLCAAFISPNVGLLLDALAILWSIFGPALIAPRYTLDLSLISFPHLVERFELITIVTFGEAVVTVAEVFRLVGFGVWSVLTFLDVVAMFGCYVVLMHNLTDHTRRHRGMRLIYCHFFVVMSVNLFTVSINLLAEGGYTRPRICVLAAIALALFYVCLSLLSHYHRKEATFTAAEHAMLAGSAVVGIVITLLGTPGGITVFLAGPLVAATGCFVVLRKKDLELQVV